MATKHSMPLRCFRHTRFTHQRDWYLSDISIGSSGHIVVSGGHKKRRETFIDIYGKKELDQSQSPYSLDFDKISDDWRRFSSLFGTTSDILVTCSDDSLQQLQVNFKGKKYKLLKSGKLKGKANCLTVKGEQIFVGLFQVNQLYIYDENLKETKSILLGEFENGGWPYDVQIISGRLFVCIAYGKALSFREQDATLLTEFDDPSSKDANSWSITGNEELDIVCIVWDRTRIVIYSLSKSTPLLTINVDEYSSKVRISNKGCFIIAKQKTGEVEMYGMRNLITYTQLKETMMSTLLVEDCVKLMKHFNFPNHQLEAIRKSETPNKDLVLALEERGVLSSSNTEHLRQAFTELSIESSSYEVAVLYRNTRSDPTLYENFLGTLSAHLTASIPGDLCDYFEICGEDRTKITSGQNPGLSLLSALNEMGVIRPSRVGALEKPFQKLGMIQAVAKIHEYQTLAKEEEERLLKSSAELSYEEKKNAFVQYLKKKIKTWYETTTPVPWKKSCKWKLSDLFIGSGLIITDAKSKKIPANIDESCKLNYKDIFSHERLESETRLVIAGEPGSGKTMLMSQLAYDWSEDKLSKVKTLILLPLKLVGQATIAQAIKDFYIPNYSTLTTNDVRLVLLDKDTPIHLLLDGLEEYGRALPILQHSEVMQVLSKDTYPECKVVITARSDFIRHLPELPHIPTLRLGLFGEKERQMYIEKVFVNDMHMQQKVLHFIQENSFILHLCSIPITFALAVHNIEKLLRLTKTHVCRVGPFMKGMIETLRCQQHSNVSLSEHHDEEIRGLSDELPYLYSSSDEESENLENDDKVRQGACETFASEEVSDGLRSNVDAPSDEKEHFTPLHLPTNFENDDKSEHEHQTRFSSSIEEVAFNGLCRGIQQLSWQKEFVERNVENFKSWVDSGIFVIEEVSLVNPQVTKEAVKHHEHESESDGGFEGNKSVAGEEKYQFPKRKDNDARKDRLNMQQDKSVELEESKLTTNEATEESLTQVPLQVKFLHKIIQEWFAAKHLSSLLWRSISTSRLQQCLDKHMQFISPDDLHYVIRFTCFLCPPSCHLIVKSLLKRYRSENMVVPEFVLSCIFLSFVECVEQPNNERKLDKLNDNIKEAIKEVCKEEITICANDNMFLQQAKVVVLILASTAQIPMRKLRLNGVVVSALSDVLSFDSGIKMGIMDTLEEIEISRWDHTIKEEDRADVVNRIIRFTGNCQNIKTVQLHFPFNPPPLDKDTLTAVINKTVIWIIGGRLRQKLDSDTGQWKVGHRQNLPAEKSYDFPWLQPKDETVDWMTNLHKEQFIDENGGTLFLREADVSLQVPAGALKNGCVLYVTVPLDPKKISPSNDVHPRLTPLIICGPENLHFHLPVKLTLPHCAVLKDPRNHTVEVQFGHKTNSIAKEITWLSEPVEYSLGEHYCSVFLNHFTGIKVDIEAVEEKILRVIPYTKLGHNRKQVMTVWLCNDFESDFQDVIQSEERNGGLPLDSYDTFRLRCFPGLESRLNIRLQALEGSSWYPDEDGARTINVKRLLLSNKSKCNFRLISDGEDDESYMYFHLRVTQTVEEKTTETTFALRKRICDLKMPVKYEKPFSRKKEIGHLFPTDAEESLRPYTAAVYMDPLKHFDDDIIMTLWLLPFDSTTEMFKGLQTEQELQHRHQVDTENSYSIVNEKPDVVTKTQFRNGCWLLSPKEMKIETERIRFGSRAKFQFTGKKEKSNESAYIELQVDTFQVEEETITFIADVELNQLLYKIRREKIGKLKTSTTEERSKSSVEDQSNKPLQSQLKLLPSTSSRDVDKERAKENDDGNIPPSNTKAKTKTPEQQLRSSFMLLKRNLAGDWRDFGRCLLITEDEITRLNKEYKDDIQEAIYQMLLSWQRKNGPLATPDLLMDALKEIDRNDLAHKLTEP